MSSTQEKLEEIFSDATAGICYEFCNPNEEHVGTPKAVEYHFKKEIQAIQALIDSAKQEAYKQGYIDAGIKALTEQSEESDRVMVRKQSKEQSGERRTERH